MNKERIKEMDKNQDTYIGQKLTEPQTLNEIEKKHEIGIIKIAGDAIIKKLNENNNKLREELKELKKIIDSKHETIDLLVARLLKYEPNIMSEKIIKENANY